jgi:hypothetical protein
MPYLPETATGQIAAAAQVGTVAGIQQKMVAARAAGARPGPRPAGGGPLRSPLPGWHLLDGVEQAYRRWGFEVRVPRARATPSCPVLARVGGSCPCGRGAQGKT